MVLEEFCCAVDLGATNVRCAVLGVSDSKNQVAALIREQGLRFNLWSSEVAAWVGEWDESILPVYQYINWVKVYSYTPGAGENGSDWTLKWVDDFDTFDDFEIYVEYDEIGFINKVIIEKL